jgi:hypothetical protein
LARLLAWTLLTLSPIAGTAAAAQTPAPPRHTDVVAVRTSRPPVIDGKLTDECWALAVPTGDFTQEDPDEGKPATEHTEVRILYDDVALYVAARLFDSDAHDIAHRLSSRDGDADADRITIYIDSMHDRLTGAIFRVSASNVQQDAILYNDTWTDSSWDAVWQSQVSVDDNGWSVEMRLPLSQLRFPRSDHQTWGVNVERFVQRKNETSWLEMVPKNETGRASRMRELVGLEGLHPTRHLELVPYTAARSEFIAPTPGNPFNDGVRSFAAAGLDMKWGLTSNLTVNATVNPDFGQVEVDPAVVNLSAFETFFPEKRAFFLEGSQILNNFGNGGSNSFWGFNSSDPQIFYSRRIGRAPQITASGDFIDAPAATTILGAAKLTGKTSGGWSVGFLEAVTDREMARTSTGAAAARSVVEPLTNYSVARVQREIGRRGGVGLIGTAVNRRLDEPVLRTGLTDTAYVGGTDAYLFLDRKRDWVITGKFAASRVSGSTDVITTLQRAAQRYYQRPDAPQVALDPAATSLSGYNSRINLNRNSGIWQVNAALWGVSPGFESNDLGFHGTGDRAGAHGVLTWRRNAPDRFTRSRNAWVAKWWTWNYNRERQGDGVNGSYSVTFLNYWQAGVSGGLSRRVLDDQLTRGGPSVINPADHFINSFFKTDSRRRVSFSGSINANGGVSGSRNRGFDLSLNLKPSSRVSISTGPVWNRSRTVAQYVTSETDSTALATLGGRYVFGKLDQTQLSMTSRVSLILTPAVSLHVFAQPLLAAGAYSHIKELARPRTFDFTEYGSGASTLTLDRAARLYTADPDGSNGPASAFTFDDPDFNLRSLRVNAIFRWEFKPGSALYAVWTRQQEDSDVPGPFALRRDARAMLAAPGDDVVLLKFAYWLGR